MVSRTSVILLLGLLLITACSKPKSVVHTERYHEAPEQQESAKQLNGLQMKAIQLMNQQQYAQSIQYLQRAVKVDPRNALNWHYLAQNYWHQQDFPNCRAMIQRAMSYSQFDQDLQKANTILLRQCTR